MPHKILFLILSILLMLTTSCGNRSLDDFQEEGEGVIRSLIQELKEIHTRQELIAASGSLQKRFDHLVSIMISAEEFLASHPERAKEGTVLNHELSDQLRIELNRLYRLEGGRQIIEKCQEKGLLRMESTKK